LNSSAVPKFFGLNNVASVAMKTIKVLFRSKRSKHGCFKVFTNVRIVGRFEPKQIHLGYMPRALPGLGPPQQERLTQKAKAEWTDLFGHDGVQIDWADAETKWQQRDAPRRSKIDRQTALGDIQVWCRDETFATAYLELQCQLASRLKGEDPSVIADWWDEKAVPRLLCCYRRFAEKNEAEPTPKGFLRYLARNIQVGYAAKDFLRATRKMRISQNASPHNALTAWHSDADNELDDVREAEEFENGDEAKLEDGGEAELDDSGESEDYDDFDEGKYDEEDEENN
jgi:hypothetical protein